MTSSNISSISSVQTDVSPTKRSSSFYEDDSLKGLSPFKRVSLSPRSPKLPNLNSRGVLFPEKIETDPFSIGSPRRTFVEQTCSELAPAIFEAHLLLKKASLKSSDLAERVFLAPESTGEGTVGGSYYIKNSEGKVILVAKPPTQEVGAPHSVKQVDVKMHGIKPGHGGIRERIAGLIPKLVGCDFGIPPVCLTELTHPNFGELSLAKIQQILSSIRIDKSYNDLFALSLKLPNAEEFVDALFSEQLEVFKSKINTQVKDVGLKEALLRLLNLNSSSEFKEQLKQTCENQPWYKGPLKGVLTQCDAFFERKSHTENELIQLSNSMYQQIENTKPALVSVQKYIENCKPIMDFEVDKIPAEEFQKLLIDMILLNADRSLGNILVNTKTNTLVLIDHTYTLPDPLFNDDFKSLKQTQFEFLSFIAEGADFTDQLESIKVNKLEFFTYKQLRSPVTRCFKESLLSLDIDNFINALKADLVKHQNEFEEYSDFCTLPEDCFLLIRFNLLVLKKAISFNKPMREIFAFARFIEQSDGFFGGEIIDCLKAVVEKDLLGQKTINEQKLDTMLNNIFNSNRLSKTAPWIDC